MTLEVKSAGIKATLWAFNLEALPSRWLFNGLANTGKVRNEMPKMAHHPYKPSDGGVRVWFWKIGDGLHMFLTGLYPVLHDMMCEKNNFITEQAALRWFQFQMFHSEPVKDDPHVTEVVILIHGESDDIIQVDQAVGEV